jgi:hypothetical protein
VSFPKARASGWRNAGVVDLIWLQCWRNNQGAARRLLEKILCMDFHLRARAGRRLRTCMRGSNVSVLKLKVSEGTPGEAKSAERKGSAGW